uniref:Carboxylic ester hydrolase n=1 Tax=Anopheles epiroticus TaxID=199890 RepID=A0A182P1B7_9DIPT
MVAMEAKEGRHQKPDRNRIWRQRQSSGSGAGSEFSDKIFTRNRLSPAESGPTDHVAMWLCAAVFIGHLFIGSSVQASCLVRYDRSATGTGILRRTFYRLPYCAYYGHSVLYQPSGNETYDTPGSMCAQYNNPFARDYVIGSEDCLFANIYKPHVAGQETPRPVLVYVHGGSYISGHGENDINGADLLLDIGVVVVTFNYRLNVLGFLKSNEFNISGNFGLKDQTTLLRWVQRNIRSFGGDPDQVTLLGQSAGAGSATHHLYIPQSKDLFHRMIVLSGSLLAPWSFLYKPQPCMERYLSELNLTTASELRTKPLDELLVPNATHQYSFQFASMESPCFIPVLEQEEIHHDNFTVNPPHQSVLGPPVTSVPILLSETAREFENQLQDISDFLLFPNLPQSWDALKGQKWNDSMELFIRNVVEQGDAKSREEVLQQIAIIANMRYPMRRLALHLADSLKQSAPVYFARFEFDGKFGRAKHLVYRSYLPESTYGAMHGDDLGYIFSPYNLEKAITDWNQYRLEWRIHISMGLLLEKFINHGHIVYDGKPLNSLATANTYLNIDKTFEVREFQDSRIFRHWAEMYNCLYYETCEYKWCW